MSSGLIMAVVSLDPIASDLAADRLRINWLGRAYESGVLSVYSISAKIQGTTSWVEDSSS
jgi:hypothetical protein